MDVFDLINAVNAEVVANKAVAKVDGSRVVVARVVDDKLVLTAEGEEMAKTVKPVSTPQAHSAKSVKTARTTASPKRG